MDLLLELAKMLGCCDLDSSFHSDFLPTLVKGLPAAFGIIGLFCPAVLQFRIKTVYDGYVSQRFSTLDLPRRKGVLRLRVVTSSSNLSNYPVIGLFAFLPSLDRLLSALDIDSPSHPFFLAVLLSMKDRIVMMIPAH